MGLMTSRRMSVDSFLGQIRDPRQVLCQSVVLMYMLPFTGLTFALL
jgi:hypothetical protein